MKKFEELAKETFGLCEATSYESLCLYRETTLRHGLDSWKENVGGYSVIVGYYNNMPVNVSFSFVEVLGSLVCFWDAVSRVVDHQMVEEFLAKTFPDAIKENAMNFHNILHEIEYYHRY